MIIVILYFVDLIGLVLVLRIWFSCFDHDFGVFSDGFVDFDFHVF